MLSGDSPGGWSNREMPTKLGQFEIVSELSKSPTGSVYKANDSNGQTVALKAIQLRAFGDQASALEESLLREIQSIKVLNSQNLCCVTNASVIEGQFCAAMEYVQGNSIATMLARGEGFSIWDLLDIGRQLCNGLDYATSQQIVHHSLEPSKIMCGWDGTVKILSYGVSCVGNFLQYAGGLSSVMHYVSPEQIRGEATDLRSNLFSLGAIFYEMVTERKAFDQKDAESLRQSILEATPVAPIQLNAKVHPILSDLIMKALAKDPAQRYQSGRELLDDLEKCKESRPMVKKAATPKPSSMVADGGTRAAAQAKFVKSGAQSQAAPPKIAATPVASAPATPKLNAAETEAPRVGASKVPGLTPPKTQAAAAGAWRAPRPPQIEQPVAPGEQEPPMVEMSSAVVEPEIETFEPSTTAPKIAVDPLMAESAPGGGGGTTFSEISELPPLKEVYIAPEPEPEISVPEPPKAAPAAYRATQRVADKPKVQPREVAAKAIKEVKGVPPQLMLYAVGGAAVLILAIAIGVIYYIHSLGDDDSGSRRPVPSAAVQQPPQAQPASPAPQPAPAAQTPAEVQPAEVPEAAPEPVAAMAPHSRSRAARKKNVAPAEVLGELTVESNPSGAQVELDGATDTTWVTPIALTNIQPGKHSVTVTKPGYAPDTRAIEVASGAKATAVLRLAQLSATLIVKSDPAGANIYVDSKDAGAKTPAQISVGKGQHLVLVRKEGYLDETMSAQFVLGQTFNFSPTLRPLGNLENMKTVGKMSKLFGKKGQADQGTISIHTQPKGAQVAINQRMLEKSVPVDVVLDPGNYVVDITASGYAPIHKIVTVEKGGKVLIDDTMPPQSSMFK